MVAKTTFTGRLNLRTLSLILVFVGLMISGYLSYSKATDTHVVCVEGDGFDCGVVQSSRYAELVGIPIAYLGVLGYLMMGFLLIMEDRGPFFEVYGLLLLFCLVLMAFIYSMYLVYLQGSVLGAWCQWCLAHETVMTVLFAVTAWRGWNQLNPQAGGD